MSRQYKCVCQNCGEIFTANSARVYCDKCWKYGKALIATDELESTPVQETLPAIPMSEVRQAAHKHHCNIKSIQLALRRRGYKAIIVYVKES